LAVTKLGRPVVSLFEVHWIDSDNMLGGNGSVYKSVNWTLNMYATQAREKVVLNGESSLGVLV
jgi:hypothetical protein